MTSFVDRCRQFLSELKRRKVYRVAAVYVATAFVVLQAVRLVFPSLAVPPWVFDTLVVLALFGFPIAVVLAWAFETTPDGGHRTEREEAAGLPADDYAAPSGVPLSVNGDGKSVAVLPFTDMSPDRDHEYFGDGLAEEVLNALTQLRGLRVAARTSSFAYRATDTDVRKIGSDLEVAAVLEGSVRRAGDQLRVTAQLVDATTGYHLWSETFDRDLEDVFAIQDEITVSIVEALEVELLGEEADRLSRVGTDDPDAYDLYLKGRHYWQRRYRVGLETALEYFEAALEEDPRFAMAHAGIAEVYWVLGVYGMADPETVRSRAIEASRRALELGPDLPETHAARGAVLGAMEYDLGGGIEEYDRALELDSSHARAEVWRSNYLGGWRHGDLDEAERSVQRAVALDPDSIYIRAVAGLAYLIADRYEDAAREADEVLRREPEAVIGLYVRGLVHSKEGEHETAVDRLERAVALTHRASFSLALLGAAQARAGGTDEALGLLRELQERRSDGGYVAPQLFAIVEAHLGRTEEALDHIEEHIENRHPGLGPLLPAGALDVLRGEPRFEALMESVELR